MYKRRTFVLLRVATVYVYVLSKAFDSQMKQPSVVFHFCQGCIWIRRNKMRIINQGLNDLLASPDSPPGPASSWIFYCPFLFSSRLPVTVFGTFPAGACNQFCVFYIMNPKQSCSMQVTDIFVTGPGRYQVCFHRLERW